MFDVAPTELMLVAAVALVVIGPKDLPNAMRFVGRWVGRAQGVARHFRSGLDEMVRQAELEEMERKWAAENERIMREHPVEAEPSVYHHVTDGQSVATSLPAAAAVSEAGEVQTTPPPVIAPPAEPPADERERRA